MRFDRQPYFKEYADRIEQVVDDLCGISEGLLCGEQPELMEELRRVALLPIFRGYEVLDDITHSCHLPVKEYADCYKYEGQVYNSMGLSKVLKSHEVRFDMLKKNNHGKEYAGLLTIGVKELFYYKKYIDGVPDYYREKGETPGHNTASNDREDSSFQEVEATDKELFLEEEATNRSYANEQSEEVDR